MKKQFLTATSLLTVLALTGCIGGEVISNDASEKDNTNSNAILVDIPDAEPIAETLPETDETAENNSEPNTVIAIDYTDSDAYLLMSDDESWKEIYADYLENDIGELISNWSTDGYKGWEYGFIFINNDYIPELVLIGDTEAQGNIILTIANGKVESFICARSGLYYKEFGNLFNNFYGHMGYYGDCFSSINENGFEDVLSGDYYDDNTGTLLPEKMIYSLDGEEVSEEEYHEAVDSLIPYGERKYISGGGSYYDTLNYLKGQSPADYKEAYSELINTGIPTAYDGVTDFALLERENGDPCLVCKGKFSFVVYSYENGLMQKTLDSFLSERSEVTIYPEIGVSRTKYLNNENDISLFEYTYNSGTVFCEYSGMRPERDEEYNIVTNEKGDPILTYTVEYETVDKNKYAEYETKYDNEKSYSPDDLTYYSKTDILEILASDL